LRSSRLSVFLVPVSKFCIEFVKLETNACDKGRFVFDPMAVGRCEEGTVGQSFDAGIGTVGSLRVIHQADMVLVFASLHDIFIGSDPVVGSGAFEGSVAERDEQSPVGVVFNWSLSSKVS